MGLTSRVFCGSVGSGRTGEGKVGVRFRLEVVRFGGWRGTDSDYGQCSAVDSVLQAKVGIGSSSTVYQALERLCRL